jgi:FkbM family methyltransferase
LENTKKYLKAVSESCTRVDAMAFLIYFFNNIRSILTDRTKSREKLALLSEYLRIELKYVFLCKLLKKNRHQEKFLGYDVSFFNYASFRLLFDEIFINKNYYFVADKSEPLILDCGSNIGMSILYLKKLYPKSKIIAFEPDKDTFAILQSNVHDNCLTGITLFNNALSDREGKISFFYDGKNKGSPKMTAMSDGSLKDKVTVDSVLLSKHVESKVDFMKMDIEGSEDAVVAELLKKDKLKLIGKAIFEYHRIEKISSFLEILKKGGFNRIYGASPAELGKNRLETIMIHAYRK